MPKPVLTLLNSSVPLASSDLGEDNLENEFMLSNLYISKAHKKIEELVSSGKDTSLQDDEAFTMEASLDRCILRLIAACCNADKLVRATELVRVLSLEKSVKRAIKLVTALKLPVLAERFSAILEERLLNETAGAITSKSVSEEANIANGIEAQQKIKLDKQPEVALPPPKFSSPQISKQGKAEQGNKGSGKKISGEGIINVVANPEQSLRPINSIDKNVNEGNIKERAGPSRIQRPANPFVKTSKVEKTSLFDSFKKTATTN